MPRQKKAPVRNAANGESSSVDSGVSLGDAEIIELSDDDEIIQLPTKRIKSGKKKAKKVLIEFDPEFEQFLSESSFYLTLNGKH